MNVTVRKVGYLFGVVILSGSCGVRDDEARDDEARDDTVAKSHSKALIVTPAAQVIAIPFPLGVARDSVAIATNGTLRVNDRVTVKKPSGAAAAVANAGNGETNLGVDATAGDVTSVGSVMLRERALISGNLKTAGTLTCQNNTTVTGTITTHATLTPTTSFSWVVSLPTSNSGDVVLQPDAIRDLQPGSYANITVNARARLNLRSGTYFARALQIEPDANLALDKRSGFCRPGLIQVATLA